MSAIPFFFGRIFRESDCRIKSNASLLIKTTKSQQSNKTHLFRDHQILWKGGKTVLRPICRCSHTVGSIKLRFCLVLSKTPNYLLWEIYAYRTMCMGLRRRNIFGNRIVKWLFLVFWRTDSNFWKQNTKYLHFSISVKPHQTSASKARNKGLYFCCFFSEVVDDFALLFWQTTSSRPLLIIIREIYEQWHWYPL